MAAPVSILGRQIAEVTAGLAPVARPSDPFQALDDLMAVIEELCPVWPARDTFKNEAHNRL